VQGWGEVHHEEQDLRCRGVHNNGNEIYNSGGEIYNNSSASSSAPWLPRLPGFLGAM
jgi:hypothetical protein